MKEYKLREDEVVLYKGKVKLEDFDGDTKFILTNINFVFITQGNQENSTIIYPIHEVKIYEGVPQIKHKGNLVEIYFLSGEVEFILKPITELHKFLAAAKKLITGKNFAKRNVEKVKNAIDYVDDTFGVDTLGFTGELVKLGVQSRVGVAIQGVEAVRKTEKAQKIASTIIQVGSVLQENKKQKSEAKLLEQNSQPEVIEVNCNENVEVENQEVVEKIDNSQLTQNKKSKIDKETVNNIANTITAVAGTINIVANTFGSAKKQKDNKKNNR